LQRLLASGVLSETRQRELSKRVERVDPLALSEHLDVLRHALLRRTHTTAADDEGEFVLPVFRYSLLACTSLPLSASKEGPAQAGHQEGAVSRDEILNCPPTTHDPFVGAWEDPGPAELIQGEPPESLPTKPHLLEEAVSAADQHSAQAQPMHVPVPGTSSRTTGEHEAGHLALTTLEEAMAAYVQEMRACGRDPKTLQWHQTSLGALRRYLWRQFHLTDICSLTTASLRIWLTDLSIAPSARTGATRTVNTVAAYARSARAFCNWLVRQG
jgi:hypothetical protein